MDIARQVARAKVSADTFGFPILADYTVYPRGEQQQDPELERRAATRGTPLNAKGAASRSGLARLLSDHLVRSALNLMFSSGIQAGLGFAFWIVMARLFTANDVGKASSLISASGLISYLALFGLNSALTRYLPTARNKNSLITSAFVTVACAAAIISVFYVLLIPAIAPKLESVINNVELIAVFMMLTAAATINLLTDSIFIAARRSSLCALTDGVIGSGSKIILGVLLAGTGAFGLFSASVGGFAAAATVSVFLIWSSIGWRPLLKNPMKTLQPLFKFSSANYVANCLNLLPGVIVPIIVLDRLGPTMAGYYFVAFQMASLLYSAVYAVEQSFMAEASQHGADWRAIRKRSRKLAVILFVPGGAILALTARWILLVFGPQYSKNGTIALALLAVAVVPIAACNWSWTVLRLTNGLSALVISGTVYAASVCGAAWLLAPHGVTGVAAAWSIGATLAAVIAGIATARTNREPVSNELGTIGAGRDRARAERAVGLRPAAGVGGHGHGTGTRRTR